MSFENFPYTNFHDLNLDWIIQKVKEAYSPDNPPESIVLSVNGETGDVVLYPDAVVQLPEVDETTWNIFRKADGTDSGIQFIKGNKAERIDGINRYAMYDAGNPPPYPVSSVNGQTGAVVISIPVSSVNGLTGNVILYSDATVRFPNVDGDWWKLIKESNGTDTGIRFESGAAAKRIDGTNSYDIYDSNNPPPYPVTSVGTLTGAVAILDTSIVTDNGTQKIKITFPVTTVDGATGAVTTWGASGNSMLKPPVESQADSWGIGRDIPSGNIGIKFEYDNNAAAGYIVFNDGTNPETKLKILTPADIPSSSGVVSFNGQTGAVTCTGADLNMSSNDTTKVATAIGNNAIAVVSKVAKTAITATPESSTTATQNYSTGDYILVGNTLYKATSNISSGDTISSSNATEVTVGSELTSLSDQIAMNQVADFATVVSNRSTFNPNYNFCYKTGKTVQLDIDITSQATTNSAFLSLIDTVKPMKTVYCAGINLTSHSSVEVVISNNGDVIITGFTSGNEYVIHVVYFTV